MLGFLSWLWLFLDFFVREIIHYIANIMAYDSAKVYNQMSDAMEGPDDELKSLCTGIRKDVSALEQTDSSMNLDQVNKAIHTMKGKVDRARSLLQDAKLSGENSARNSTWNMNQS